MKLIKSKKSALAMGLTLTSLLLTAPTFAEDVSAATTKVSQQVQQIKQTSKPKTNTTAKPAPHLVVVVNGKEQKLSDPILLDNGRVFLPVRALGNILGVSVDYLESDKVATATNPTAHLELPLGYNKAVKDKSVILPIDTNNANTSIIAYNSRTYLPVRFISENLGYRIEYKSPIVSITTDGSAPTFPIVTPPPTKPVDPPTTSNKPPTYKGKKDGEYSKDDKWIWDNIGKDWIKRNPNQSLGNIDHGELEFGGPNGNWQ